MEYILHEIGGFAEGLFARNGSQEPVDLFAKVFFTLGIVVDSGGHAGDDSCCWPFDAPRIDWIGPS
jgi:hypothetical protein